MTPPDEVPEWWAAERRRINADDKLTVSRNGAIGEGSAGATAPSPALSDRRRYFAGDVDSYLAIFDWMKACGDTVALANEVQFRGPLMLWPGPNCGWEVARPGEWVERTDCGFVAVPASPLSPVEGEPTDG